MSVSFEGHSSDFHVKKTILYQRCFDLNVSEIYIHIPRKWVHLRQFEPYGGVFHEDVTISSK